jgi:cytochrome c biogenesis protein CcmG/thiol:disulfide interchange protein DsbE
MKRTPTSPWFLGAVLVAALGCATRPGSAGGGTSRGLDLTLPDVEGNIVTPSAETGQEVFVLVFWATWCQPCQQELTAMDRLYAEKQARGLKVYAISIDSPDTASQVVPWVQREGYRFEVLLDRETEVLTRYNPRGDIPYYVVLDASGKVLKDHQGYMSGDIEELRAFLETVLPSG